MSPLSQYYQTTDGTHSHLPSYSVPSTSSQRRTHSDSVGSIGLTNLYLRVTPFSASNNTCSTARTQIYDHWRQYIIPYGAGFSPDDRIAKITTKCICRHFKGYWTNW